MRERTILFPVCGALYPYRLTHRSFWLARYLPAKLHLVEVLLPTGWIRWLLSAFSREDREWRLQEVKRQVLQQDRVHCDTEGLEVRNRTTGIVEAAWRVKPKFVVLLPALQDALGKTGLRDLKTRLGEMGRCMLVLLRNGHVVCLEPCNTVDSPDLGQLVHAKFG